MRVDTATDAHNIAFQKGYYFPVKIRVKRSPKGSVYLLPEMRRPKRAKPDFMLNLCHMHTQGPNVPAQRPPATDV
jgi:hypothetical protein